MNAGKTTKECHIIQCPTCQVTLRAIEYEGIRIDSCDDCGGTWLDAGEFKQIIRAREVRFDPDERRALARAAKITGIKLDNVDREFTCPSCGKRTAPVHYGGDSGIIIDRCPACRGIWLDQGELEKIQQLVEGWEDNLPEELAKHGAKLRQVALDAGADDGVKVSRFGFVNTIINGIIDIFT